MARGRYAASAAKRRAESAEEQLDRLMPKLIDAQRVAKQYKAAAERVPVLERQLRELKDRAGVPVAEHEAALRSAEADFAQMCTDYEDALRLLSTRLHKARHEWVRSDLHYDGPKIVDVALLEALVILGVDNVRPLLKALNWERWYTRHLISTDAINRWHGKDERERRTGLVEMSAENPTARSYAKWKSRKYDAARAVAVAEAEAEASEPA